MLKYFILVFIYLNFVCFTYFANVTGNLGILSLSFHNDLVVRIVRNLPSIRTGQEFAQHIMPSIVRVIADNINSRKESAISLEIMLSRLVDEIALRLGNAGIIHENFINKTMRGLVSSLVSSADLTRLVNNPGSPPIELETPEIVRIRWGGPPVGVLPELWKGEFFAIESISYTEGNGFIVKVSDTKGEEHIFIEKSDISHPDEPDIGIVLGDNWDGYVWPISLFPGWQ